MNGTDQAQLLKSSIVGNAVGVDISKSSRAVFALWPNAVIDSGSAEIHLEAEFQAGAGWKVFHKEAFNAGSQDPVFVESGKQGNALHKVRAVVVSTDAEDAGETAVEFEVFVSGTAC